MSQKILIPSECAEWLLEEVDSLRRKVEIQNAKINVMEGFFELVDRLGSKKSIGYREDMLWQAKKDIEYAKGNLSEPKANE